MRPGVIVSHACPSQKDRDAFSLLSRSLPYLYLVRAHSFISSLPRVVVYSCFQCSVLYIRLPRSPVNVSLIQLITSVRACDVRAVHHAVVAASSKRDTRGRRDGGVRSRSLAHKVCLPDQPDS